MDRLHKVLGWAGIALIAFLAGVLLGRYGVLDNTSALVIIVSGLVLILIIGPAALKGE